MRKRSLSEFDRERERERERECEDDSDVESEGELEGAESLRWNFVFVLLEKVAGLVEVPTRRLKGIQSEFLDQVCLLKPRREIRGRRGWRRRGGEDGGGEVGE